MIAETELTALDAEHPLRPVVKVWREKVRLAKRDKREKFGVFAEEAMAFYTGPAPDATDDAVWKRFMAPPPMMESGEYTPPEAHFHFIIAKVAELVQIFGPVLYHRNPVRTVEPRPIIQIPEDAIIDPQLRQQLQQLDEQMQTNPDLQQDPMFVMQYQQIQGAMQQATAIWNEMVMSQQKVHTRAKARALVMEKLLNYLPNENDLKTHARRAINEALIKGAGCLKTEMHERKDGTRLVRSVFLSVDDWGFDPDARDREDVWWQYEECLHPVWDVAEEYGLDEEYLRRHCSLTSSNGQAEYRQESDDGGSDIPPKGKSNDLLRYWKIYSRMGVGDKLSGVAAEFKDTLKSLGKNAYIVVAEGVPFPLNCPSEHFKDAIGDEEKWAEIVERFQWPIPFWVDDEWPISELVFHEIPNCAWPMSHIRPALCHLKFLNWAMSYLGDKVTQTNRTIFAMKKGANPETKSLLESGPPVTVVELSEFEGKLSDVFQAIPIGGDHKSMWEMVQAEQINFDKSSGLTEMMYAIPGGIRSATEAQIKENARNVRPDDMANKVEDWMSSIARKEALAAALEMSPQGIGKILGPGAAKLWEMFVASEDAADLALELDYRIEAGTAKKPNKETQQFQIQQAISNLGPTLQMLVQQGVSGPWNELMKRFMESLDYHDYEAILIPPPSPPTPQQQQMEQLQMAQLQADVNKTNAEAQAKMAQAQTEGQDAGIKMQAEQAKLMVEQQKAQMDMAGKQADMQFEREKAGLEMQLERERAMLELGMDQQSHQQEMRQDEQRHMLDLKQQQMSGVVNVAMAKQKMQTDAEMGKQKIAQQKQMAKAKPKPQKPSGK